MGALSTQKNTKLFRIFPNCLMMIYASKSNMIRSSWTPCLEFSDDGDIYLNTRMGPGYYDNRYWTMYKLPMYGCTDPSEVIREIDNSKQEFRTAKVIVLGFDSVRQVQTSGFIVRK